MAVTAEFQESVAAGLERDKGRLFGVADDFLDNAAISNWALWVVCQPSAYYVNHYLRTLYELSNSTPDVLPPEVHLASADIAHYPYQQDAIRAHVNDSVRAIPKDSNVLLVMGAVVGLAQLNFPRKTLIDCGAGVVDMVRYNHINQSRRSSVVPVGDVWLTNENVINDTVGLECVFGYGEPIEPAGFDPASRQYIEQAVGLVAQQFVYERESR